MSGLEGSQCGTSYAFVSWIIKDSMIVLEQHSQPCSQYYRPQAGHSRLRAKPLNAKQLRSDRGNGISIAANRFGCCNEAWCSVPPSSADWSPNCTGAYQSAAKQRLEKTLSVRFNSLREQTLASKDNRIIVESLKSKLIRQHFVCGEQGLHSFGDSCRLKKAENYLQWLKCWCWCRSTAAFHN